MKKAILMVIALTMVVQDSYALKNLIFFDPTELLFGRVEIGYEIELSPKNSIAIIPSYEGIGMANEWHTRLKMAYSYSFDKTFKGFWISPSVSVFYVELKSETNQYLKQTTVEPGIAIGKRYLLYDKYYMGIGGGAGPSFQIKRDEGIVKRKAYFYSMGDIGFVF